MNNDEFGNRCYALGVGKGRLEASVEIIECLEAICCDPLIAKDDTARMLAREVAKKCEDIIESVSLLTTPTV